MSDSPTTVEKRINLSAKQAVQFNNLSQKQQMSEDQIVEKALDLLFSMIDDSDEAVERARWSYLSEPSLRRVWDNEADAVYDNWRELYGDPPR